MKMLILRSHSVIMEMLKRHKGAPGVLIFYRANVTDENFRTQAGLHIVRRKARTGLDRISHQNYPYNA